MIHELRTYTIVIEGGGVRELERRFGNAIDIRTKHSQLGFFFHTLTGNMSQVVHLWPYENLHHRAEARANSNRDESNRWPPGIGELFERQEVEILLPAPFMQAMAPRNLGRVWELSWVDYRPDQVSNALKGYEKTISAREAIYPVGGCWTVDIGASIGRIYTLEPFKDWEHRDQVLDQSAAIQWPPATGFDEIARGSKLLEPAHFSPLQ